MFCGRFFHLDDSNGAAVANRCLARCLARRGFGVEVLCGTIVDAGPGADLAEWFRSRGWACDVGGGDAWIAGSRGGFPATPPRLRSVVEGVPITVPCHPLRLYDEPDATEVRDFLGLFDETFDRLRPSVVVSYGGDRLTREILARSRRRTAATVFTLHNFQYHTLSTFADVDAIVVPSRFAADHYRDSIGLVCTVLPNIVDLERIRVERPAPRYVTFVNRSPEKGVFPFVGSPMNSVVVGSTSRSWSWRVAGPKGTSFLAGSTSGLTAMSISWARRPTPGDSGG